ncbi:histidine kinase [Microbispora sp. H10830]|uniref:sensor histidine kinase n=1 Tax=Microbispora sp. H10830 TaxID=2729109 RepID=UPI0015FF9555|nr:histidine kinase [Microbispora sp. H10830]
MGRKAAYLKDVLLWAVLGLPALWAGLTNILADRYTWPEVIAGLATIGVAVALARPRPLGAMLVTAALWAGSVAVRSDPTVFFPALAVTSYLAGVRMARARPALLGLSAAAVVAAAAVPFVRWLLAAQWDLGAWFFAVTGIALFGLVPWLAGHARHQSLALTRAGWERAGHLERERRMVAEQARLRERTTIAREMHDLLGHDLSLVALRIGALEVDAGLPESRRRAASEAREAVTAAAERLRDIVAVLRDGDDPGQEHEGLENEDTVHEDTTHPPGESVGELVRRATAAGMPVTLYGAQEEARIPAPALATVRRVVREGLTNAAKHAPGAPVTVRLAHAQGETVVTVANAAPHRPGRGVTGGHGLRALAERVRLRGGSLESGPADGGFTLTVRLPHSVPPPVPPPVPPRTASRPVELDLALARRRVRRTRLAAALVCLGAAGGVAAFVLGFTVYEAVTSVLPPAEFAKLRIGQAESEVAAVLPARTRIDDPSWPEPPIPPGARCRYYSTSPEPFGDLTLYRLCFAGGRLVAKAFLPS